MTEQEQFIEQIAPIIRRYAFLKGYKYPSAIIAQACLESNFGRSKLSADYNNFFGLKAGAHWEGQSVVMTTKEEYSVGSLTTIKDAFRVYMNMEDGVKGYFDFINTQRYSNLKDARTAYEYLQFIKEDGYATSSKYVTNNYNVIAKYNLERYDWINDIELNNALTTIANYVIAKRFGNGHDLRKDMIYDMIRVRVNEIAQGGAK